MPQADLGALILLNLIAAGFTLYVWLGPYSKEGRKSDRYKLFSVRDRIIWLVATKKLKKNEKAFTFLYKHTNDFIPIIRPFQLSDLVKIISTSIPMKSENEKREIIDGILNHDDPEVRMVGAEFFEALADILFKRSIVVKLMVWGLSGLIATKQIQLFFVKIFKSQAETYFLYKEMNSLAHKNFSN